jgi:hypothetical protein
MAPDATMRGRDAICDLPAVWLLGGFVFADIVVVAVQGTTLDDGRKRGEREMYVCLACTPWPQFLDSKHLGSGRASHIKTLACLEADAGRDLGLDLSALGAEGGGIVVPTTSEFDVVAGRGNRADEAGLHGDRCYANNHDWWLAQKTGERCVEVDSTVAISWSASYCMAEN